ncbi:MAG: hypothetical protein ACYCVY_09155 [Acidiferrobacteraceae bacterium]
MEKIEPDVSVARRFLDFAECNIADTHVRAITAENRFDAAYKAIMQLAHTALQATGCRAFLAS